MPSPEPHHSGQPDRPAESAPPGRTSAAPDARVPAAAENPEAAYGGADAVEKTSYVVGRGTDPTAMAGGKAGAHPSADAGPNYLAWGAGAVAAVVAIVYLITLMT